MKLNLLFAFIVFVGISAFASEKLECKNTKDLNTIIQISFSKDQNDLFKLEDFNLTGVSSNLGEFVISNITDSLIVPGVIEIHTKKEVEPYQGAAVVSLSGDYSLTELKGSLMYTEKNLESNKIINFVIDLSCK